MTQQPRESEGTPGAGRFAPRRRPESETHLDSNEIQARDEAEAEARLERTVTELRTCLGDAEAIVALGRDRFDGDPLLRRAAKNVLTELAETVGRLPQRWLDERAQVEWHAIRGMRNRLVLVYEHTDFNIVWNALAADCAELRNHIPDD